MKTTSMKDVALRNDSLASDIYRHPRPVSTSIRYRRLQEHYSYDHAKQVLECWYDLNPSNTELSLQLALEVFDQICETDDNPSHILEAARIITERAIPKVRTGAQTKEFVKRRVRRFKTKLHTKFNNKIDDVEQAVDKSIGMIKNNLTKNAATVSKQLKNNIDKGKQQLTGKQKAVQEANELIIESLNKAISYDVVLTNQATLNRRYNFDKLVNEMDIEDSEDVRDCVLELCSYVDTYRMPFSYKYDVCVENIAYTLYKNGVQFEMPLLVETVTDYFSMDNDITDLMESISLVLNTANFVDVGSDINGLQYIFNDKDKEKFDKTFVMKEFILDDTHPSRVNLESSNENKFQTALNSFRKETNKTPERFKSIIRALYVQSPDDVISATPSILSFIRGMFVVVGTAAINPVAAIPVFLVDQFIKMKVSRKTFEKYISDYKKEIEKVEKRIDKAKSKDAKARLEEYKKGLEKGLTKLKDREDLLYTDAENDKRHEHDYDDDTDFDLDFNFDESTLMSIGEIDSLAALIESVPLSEMDLESIIEANIHRIPYEFILPIVEYIKMNPYMFDTERIARTFKDRANVISDRENVNSYYDYLKVSTLKEAYDSLMSLENTIPDMSFKDMEMLSCQNEYYNIQNIVSGYHAISEAINSLGILQEMNVKNSIKLASENLKRTMQGLSDKDKTISREIDATFNTLSRAAERSLMNENREAVIRGSLIPSASKIIKKAILTGAAWAVNPAIAVIGVIGSIALSKKLQAKERQLILDDIEIELKMTDKYIRAAEDNNDTKALKSLYQIQRSLQRQQQRVKYKMSVYGGKVPKTPNDQDDDD